MAVGNIIRALNGRAKDGYVAGKDDDGDHIALVVEGGGMRGVAAGGMVSALEDLGLTDCFDSVHGSSAGAAAGAYFASGQANIGTRIFYEDLIGKEFIDTRRFLWGRDIMDTSYLVDHVMMQVKPIDFQRLKEISPRLYIVMTDIDSGEPHIVSEFKDYEHYRSCLKASITLPFIAGRPKNIDGLRVMDGGLLQQIAVESALSLGATKVLGLQTRRKDEQYRPEKSWKLSLQASFLQFLYGGRLGAIYRDRSRRTNLAVNHLEAGSGPNGEELFGINLPDGIDYIHRLTQAPDDLKRAAEVSKESVIKLFRDIV